MQTEASSLREEVRSQLAVCTSPRAALCMSKACESCKQQLAAEAQTEAASLREEVGRPLEECAWQKHALCESEERESSRCQTRVPLTHIEQLGILSTARRMRSQSKQLSFAAIRSDGSVVTWGDAGCGGDSSDVQDQLTNVLQIQATQHVFSTILGNGSVVLTLVVTGGLCRIS